MKIIEDSSQRLVLEDQSAWLGGLLGFILGRRRVEFDKRSQMARVVLRRMLRSRSVEIPFVQIHDVQVEADPAPGRADPACRFSLVTTNGVQPLTDRYRGGYARLDVQRVAILKALGRPVSDAFDESLRQLVRSGRSIDAVALLRLQKKMDLVTAQLKVAELEKQLHSGG